MPPGDARLSSRAAIAGAEDRLHVNSAAHRIDDAAKLHEHAITGVLDDAAAIMADLRLDDLAPIGQQAEMSALLVGAREPRIADHVGSQNRRQPTLEARLFSRPQVPEQAGCFGCQHLDEDGRNPGQRSGDPGSAYLGPKIL